MGLPPLPPYAIPLTPPYEATNSCSRRPQLTLYPPQPAAASPLSFRLILQLEKRVGVVTDEELCVVEAFEERSKLVGFFIDRLLHHISDIQFRVDVCVGEGRALFPHLTLRYTGEGIENGYPIYRATKQRRRHVFGLLTDQLHLVIANTMLLEEAVSEELRAPAERCSEFPFLRPKVLLCRVETRLLRDHHTALVDGALHHLSKDPELIALKRGQGHRYLA